MTLKRICVIIAVIIATSVACYLVLGDFSDHDAHLAKKAWIKGEMKTAHQRLSHVWGELPAAERHLYRAYIHRDEGLFRASDQQLERALAVNAARRKPELSWEIQLGRALNAFLNGEVEKGSHALSLAEPILPNHSYTLLLKGMGAFLMGDYEKAGVLLSEPTMMPAESEWLNETINHHLSLSWKEMALARCYIEEGEFIRARQLLEGLHDKNATHLFALSFLREGQSQPVAIALQTYNEAAHYLSSQALTDEILQSASRFTEDTVKPNLFAQGLVFFSHYLPSQELANRATLHILKNPKSAVALNNTLPQGPFRSLVGKVLEKELYTAIKENRIAQILPLWKLTQHFTNDVKKSARHASDKLRKALLATIDSKPDLAKQYLALWQELQCDRSQYEELAADLVDCSHSLWADPGKQKQGFELMILAESLLTPSEQSNFRDSIAHALKRRYNQAKNHNDIEVLSLVHRAARYFRIEALNPNQEGEVANQLADATYFLSTGNYHEAGKRAKWVVQLDPENARAHRILGLSHYVQHRYHAALMELGPLPTPDQQIIEIVGICQLLVGDKEEGKESLEKLSEVKELADRSYLLLGYHSLSEENPKEGARWLKKIRHKESEVRALLARCAYLKEEWTLALSYIAKCEEPYLSHEGVKSLAAMCHLALHQPEKARDALSHQSTQTDMRFSELFEKLFGENK